MNNFITQAEQLLLPEAQKYCPEGTEPKAIIHQWLNAIAYEKSLFGIQENVDSKRIIKILKDRDLYQTNTELKSKLHSHLNLRAVNAPKFTFIDLFAGIGGVRLGFQQNEGLCVFSSEFDKHAQATYEKNHGDFPFGDITKINPELIPDHDVLLAGFPCQPFSHAGLKLGVDDTRGTLFHDIARILDIKKPKFAVLENVKGLISNDKGYTLKVILKTLTKMGYSCNISKEIIENGSTKEIQTLAKKMVLKAIDFGIPQNRQRIYIVLWKDGELDKFRYPSPLNITTRVGDILESNPDPKLTISDKLWQGHKRRKIENAKNGKGFGYGLFSESSPYTNTISARYYKDGSEALIEQVDKNPRKISPREAARLQGFPDEFEPNESKVQAYKQFGNSVTVNVVKALAQQVAKNLL
jgi:DNA (cytosine-5)-methyltransferase 1